MAQMKRFLAEIEEKKGILYVFLTVATFSVYSFSLPNGFIWDDYMVLVDNTFVHDLVRLPEVFTKDYITSPKNLPFIDTGEYGSGEGSYRPVTTLIHFLEYRLWGLTPFFYHLVNVVLHCIMVCLVFCVLELLFKNLFISLVTALLFAVNPAHSEAVLTISFREDLLCGMFFMAAFICFIKVSDQKKPLFLIFSILFYLLALFSKEMAITFPVVCIYYEYFYKRNRFATADALRLFGGLVLASGFYLWVRFVMFAPAASFKALHPSDSFGINVLTMIKVVGMYFGWLLTGLNVHLTKPDPYLIEVFSNFSSIIVFVAIVLTWILSLFLSLPKRPFFQFSLVWFFVTILPVLGIIPIHNIVAGRYLYIPSIGFLLMITGLLWLIRNKQLQVVGVVLYVVFLSVLTIARAFILYDELTARKEFVQYYPQDPLSYRSLSAAYTRLGLDDHATGVLARAVEYFSDDFNLHMDLARAYRKEGEYQKALDVLGKVLGEDPGNYYLLNEKCINLALLKKKEEAAACFEKIFMLFPDDKVAKENFRRFKQY